MKETKKQKEKIAKVMHEFKEGELHIGKSDKIVKNPKQAVAIALSQANASKMAEGGGVESSFNSTKKGLEGKDQQHRIDELINVVKKNNWSSKPLTVESGVVKTYAKMYDLEPIRVASIFNKYQKPKMADGGKVGEDFKFNYMMLDRLQSDNDYYLKHPDEQNLWAGSVDKQISEMKKLWNQLPKDKKPEWLSMEDILEYEKKMKKNYANGGLVEKQKTKKNDKYFIREEYDSNGNKYNAVNLSYERGLKDIEYYKKDKSYVYENGVFYKKSTGNLSMIFRESKLYSEGGDIGECYYTIGGL